MPGRIRTSLHAAVLNPSDRRRGGERAVPRAALPRADTRRFARRKEAAKRSREQAKIGAQDDLDASSALLARRRSHRCARHALQAHAQLPGPPARRPLELPEVAVSRTTRAAALLRSTSCAARLLLRHASTPGDVVRALARLAASDRREDPVRPACCLPAGRPAPPPEPSPTAQAGLTQPHAHPFPTAAGASAPSIFPPPTPTSTPTPTPLFTSTPFPTAPRPQPLPPAPRTRPPQPPPPSRLSADDVGGSASSPLRRPHLPGADAGGREGSSRWREPSCVLRCRCLSGRQGRRRCGRCSARPPPRDGPMVALSELF